ncbi:hypothetical protein [Leifsonia sp. NPDC058248]|uniref:hypothetical protein n=1 Tax=Leifsonia sp. NPDC058248 TaxID=3346402 RepID=UPI0036DE892F
MRIPAAAIKTNASGTTIVIDRKGKPTTVHVLATAHGQSVVEGIAEGIEVRVEAAR